MKCCAIATEDHVSVGWGVDSSPETFLEEMRYIRRGHGIDVVCKNGEEIGDGLAFAPVEDLA